MFPLKHGLSTLRTCSRHHNTLAHGFQSHSATSRFIAQRWYAANANRQGPNGDSTENPAGTSNPSSAPSTQSEPTQPATTYQSLMGRATENILQAQAQAFNPDTNLPLTEGEETTGKTSNPFMPSDSADSKLLQDLRASPSYSQARRPGRARPAPAPPIGGGTTTLQTQTETKSRRAAFKLFRKVEDGQPEVEQPSILANTVRYKLYVLAKRQNCIMTLKDHKNGTVYWASGGRVGFKGVGEGTYEAGYQCAVKIFERLRVHIAQWQRDNVQIELEILLRGFGQGRSALLKALTLPEGDGVREVVYCITDRTQIKIGGVRLQKARRL